MTTATLTDPAAAPEPMDGLLHAPVIPDWSDGEDGAGLIWGLPSLFVSYGHADGFRWATDNFTITAAPTDEPYRDTQGRPWEAYAGMNDGVLRLLRTPLDSALFVATTSHLAGLGGHMHIDRLGLFDLNRLAQAAVWVADNHDELVIACCDGVKGQRACLFGMSGRMALVMGLEANAKAWNPTIQLPLRQINTPYPECRNCGAISGVQPNVWCQDAYHSPWPTDHGVEPLGWHTNALRRQYAADNIK